MLWKIGPGFNFQEATLKTPKTLCLSEYPHLLSTSHAESPEDLVRVGALTAKEYSQ